MLTRRSFARAATATVLTGALLAAWLHQPAPGWTAAQSRPPIAIQGGDFYFSAPDTVQAGLITLDFSNEGRETHHAQLVRFPDALSMEQFAAALEGDERTALGLVQQVGGAASVGPGGSTEVAFRVEPGLYALICVIPSPSDRVRHFAKGMVRPLVVTEPELAAEPPATSGTIHLHDFSIDMPDVVPTGRVTYQVVNDGPAHPHEVAIVRLAPGKTADDVRQAIMNPGGPPPFQPVGGFQSTEVGGDGYVTLALEAGRYAAICRVTEPNSGMSHVHLGMVKGFEVQ